MDSGSIKFPVVFSEPAPQNAFGLKIYSDLGIDTIPQVIMVDKKGIVRYNRVVQQDIETTLNSCSRNLGRNRAMKGKWIAFSRRF